MSKRACTGLKRQSGLSYTAFLVILSVSIFIGLFAIKIGPIYFEYYTVTKIVDDLNENEEVLAQSRQQVLRHVSQAYRMNSLWSLKAEDTVVLMRDGSHYKVGIKYAQRAKLFGNIDLITSFDTTGKDGEKLAEADDS